MTLTPLLETDREALLELLTDPQIKLTYMLPDFAEKEDALPLQRRLVQLSREKSRFVRGIRAGNTLVGFLNDVEIENGTIELGYVIHPRHWGKGYATKALTLALEELALLGYREAVAGAFSENKASLRVMEKAAMVPSGKTDTIEYRGQVHRCLYYRKDLT